MDILAASTKQRSLEGARMYLRWPNTGKRIKHQGPDDDKPRSQYLLMYGPDSPPIRLAMREAVQSAQAEAAEQKRKKNRKKRTKTLTQEQLDAEARADARKLAKCVAGGEVFIRDEWREVDQELAFELFYEVSAFRGQAMAFITDLGNFTASAESMSD